MWRLPALSRRLRLGTLDRAPDLFRRQRHVDLLDAVISERVEHRVDDNGEAAGAAGFAAALGAQRIRSRGRGMIADRDWWDGLRPRPCVVPERTGERLAGIVVIDLFDQRLADALRDAAMQLTGDDHRIDDGAEIIDAAIAHDFDHPGLGIDLDLGDMTAVREGRGDLLGGMIDVERGRHDVRLLAFAQALGKLHDADRAIGAGVREAAVCELDVAL